MGTISRLASPLVESLRNPFFLGQFQIGYTSHSSPIVRLAFLSANLSTSLQKWSEPAAHLFDLCHEISSATHLGFHPLRTLDSLFLIVRIINLLFPLKVRTFFCTTYQLSQSTFKLVQASDVSQAISIFSQLSYLLSLRRGSAYQWKIAALLGEAGLQFYRAKNEQGWIKIFEATLGIFRLYQAYRTYQLFSTPRYFVVIRHAEKASNDFYAPLSVKGIQHAEFIGTFLKDFILRKIGSSFIRLIASPMVRGQQTAAALGKALGVSEVVTDPRLRERDHIPLYNMSHEETLKDPRWIAYNQLSDYEKFFTHLDPTNSQAESGLDQANRFTASLEDALEDPDRSRYIPVFVTHYSVSMKFLLSLRGYQVPLSCAKGLEKTSDWILFVKRGNQISAVEHFRPPALPEMAQSSSVHPHSLRVLNLPPSETEPLKGDHPFFQPKLDRLIELVQASKKPTKEERIPTVTPEEAKLYFFGYLVKKLGQEKGQELAFQFFHEAYFGVLPSALQTYDTLQILEPEAKYPSLPLPDLTNDVQLKEALAAFLIPSLISSIHKAAVHMIKMTKLGDYLVVFGNTPSLIGEALRLLISTDHKDSNFRRVIDFPFSGTPNAMRQNPHAYNIMTPERLHHLRNRLKTAGFVSSNDDFCQHSIYFIDVILSGSGIALTCEEILREFQKRGKPYPDLHVISLNSLSLKQVPRNASICLQDAGENQTTSLYFPSVMKTHFIIPCHPIPISGYEQLDRLPSPAWRLLPEYYPCLWNPEYDSLLTTQPNPYQEKLRVHFRQKIQQEQELTNTDPHKKLHL